MTIGEKIKAAREAAHLTQTDLGRICGTTKQTIYKYETGTITNIPLDRLELIAQAVHVPAAELMGWKNRNSAAPLVNSDSDLTSYLELLRTRPEMRALLDTAVGATKEEVEENVRFIEALRHAKKAD